MKRQKPNYWIVGLTVGLLFIGVVTVIFTIVPKNLLIKSNKPTSEGTELGWFVAFNADDSSNKQLLALTMVEDVKNRGGSHCAITIAKSVFE